MWDHFSENSVFIGFWLTNRVSSKTESIFWFARLDSLAPLSFSAKICIPGLFPKCCFLIGWTDRQTNKQTNIFCLEDPFFQKREHRCYCLLCGFRRCDVSLREYQIRSPQQHTTLITSANYSESTCRPSHWNLHSHVRSLLQFRSRSCTLTTSPSHYREPC